MNGFSKKRNPGFTMIEILVASFIMVIIVIAVYNVIARAMDTSAFATAKGVAKDQAELVLRFLERDISSSISEYSADPTNPAKKIYNNTFSTAGGVWKMKIPGDKTPGSQPNTAEYSYDSGAKTVTRTLKKSDGTVLETKVLSKNTETLTISTTSPSQLLIEIKTGVTPEGTRKMQFFDQQLLVTIKSMVEANVDKRWKDSTDIRTNY